MTYNGHKNWNHWNVSLWLYNDESLYNAAKRCVCASSNKDEAARNLMAYLSPKTPDGAPYSFTAVRAALRDF